MTRRTIPLSILLVAGAVGLPAAAQSPDTAKVTARAEAEVEAEVDADDILEVLDLPIAAFALYEAEVEAPEIDLALSSAADAGVSAGDATLILEAEADAVKARGKRKGLGAWVARRVAAGKRGHEISAMVKVRGESPEEEGEAPELSEAEKAELKALFEKRREEEKARRKAMIEQRKALKAEGKVIKLRGKKRHEARLSALAAARIERLETFKAKGVKDERLDKELVKLEKVAGKEAAKKARANAHAKVKATGMGPGMGRGRPEAPGDRRADRAVEAKAEADARKAEHDAAKAEGDAPGMGEGVELNKQVKVGAEAPDAGGVKVETKVKVGAGTGMAPDRPTPPIDKVRTPPAGMDPGDKATKDAKPKKDKASK